MMGAMSLDRPGQATYALCFRSENRAVGDKRIMESRGQGGPLKAPRSLRILIADDERDTVLTLMMLLRDEGHEVRGVYSGRQVLDAIRGFDPDVLVLEDFLRREVSHHPHARGGQAVLIGISGAYMNPVDKLLSTVVGFDSYLLKPCSPNAL